ncbi:MAG: hypothetical protein ACI8P0_006633 [Planctomycetaceae bacterium]|jgi:hypothetical protein
MPDLIFHVLSEQEFDAECTKIFEPRSFADDHQKNVFFDVMIELQVETAKTLAKRWAKEVDWEVSRQCEAYYWLCGAIYSERIFGPDYLQAIATVLLGSADPELWAYDTVCEVLVNPDGKTAGECVDDRGEFFQRADAVFINGDSMESHHRRQLGCDL